MSDSEYQPSDVEPPPKKARRVSSRRDSTKPSDVEPSPKKTRRVSSQRGSTKAQKDNRSDLIKARSTFFKILDECKSKLGGAQAEEFKELFISARMWEAQEDLFMS